MGVDDITKKEAQKRLRSWNCQAFKNSDREKNRHYHWAPDQGAQPPIESLGSQHSEKVSSPPNFTSIKPILLLCCSPQFFSSLVEAQAHQAIAAWYTSLLVSDLSNSTKISSNTETAMLSTAWSFWMAGYWDNDEMFGKICSFHVTIFSVYFGHGSQTYFSIPKALITFTSSSSFWHACGTLIGIQWKLITLWLINRHAIKHELHLGFRKPYQNQTYSNSPLHWIYVCVSGGADSDG